MGQMIKMAASLMSSMRLSSKILNYRLLHCSTVRLFKQPDDPDPDEKLMKSIGQEPEKIEYEKEQFPGEFGLERPKGTIYDKKPFKIYLEAGKRYSWCTCGRSRNQPFCDGRHKFFDGTSAKKIHPKFRPIRFVPEESKEYWLCNCKQTGNQPYCDGTHRREDIQSKRISH